MLVRDSFDAARLTAILSRCGILHGARVTDLAVEPVGIGMIADSLRFRLFYDRQNEGPPSVVGKFASADPTSRATGVDFDLYLAEVRFYQELAGTVAVVAPACYFAEIDETTGAFAIILEDLAPARTGNQLTGCSLEESELAIIQAAALHGPRWNDASLLKLSYLRDRSRGLAAVRKIFPSCLAEFHRRYDAVLEPEYMAICDRFGALIGAFHARSYAPFTLTHWDFRPDNMMFAAKGGLLPLAILDWQSISISSGALDVAYFMGLSLSIDMRRRHEPHLVGLYLEELKKYGVHDYAPAAFQRDYRVALLQGVSTAVFASASTKRTVRGDAMFLSMARGACAQAIDAESLNGLAT